MIKMSKYLNGLGQFFDTNFGEVIEKLLLNSVHVHAQLNVLEKIIQERLGITETQLEKMIDEEYSELTKHLKN
jgi:hypothetical protein